jgi:hypothetical protein
MSEVAEPVYWRGLQWAVTPYGVECLDGRYHIKAGDIWHDEAGCDWLAHMRHQYWVNLDDLGQALEHARQQWPERAELFPTRSPALQQTLQS